MNLVKSFLRTYFEPTGNDHSNGQAATLYECPACRAVFIGVDKQSCGSCERTVEPISNERELGLV